MKLPQLKYNAAEIASLSVLLAVAAILAAVLLARSCATTPDSDNSVIMTADSIAAAIDRSGKSPVIDSPMTKKAKNKKIKRTAADRHPASRDYLDEPVNE